MRQTVARRRISLWIVLSVLNPAFALAAPRTPCTQDTVNAAITAIAESVERTDNRVNLRRLAEDAKTQLDSTRNRTDAGCLNYLIGSAYFVLSQRVSARADAFRAVQA